MGQIQRSKTRVKGMKRASQDHETEENRKDLSDTGLTFCLKKQRFLSIHPMHMDTCNTSKRHPQQQYSTSVFILSLSLSLSLPSTGSSMGHIYRLLYSRWKKIKKLGADKKREKKTLSTMKRTSSGFLQGFVMRKRKRKE